MQQTGNPERDAAALLSSLNPQPSPPIDPISIARQLGLAVYVGGTGYDTAGMLVKRRGEDATIYLNRSDSRNRQRFTCAHELGHYVRRSGMGEEDWEADDKRDYMATTGRDPEERYANGFAAALLMPALDVRGHFEDGTPASIAKLAVRYQVSVEAMQYRLANLGLI